MTPKLFRYGDKVKVVGDSFFDGIEGIAIDRKTVGFMESDNRFVYRYLVEYDGGKKTWFLDCELERK